MDKIMSLGEELQELLDKGLERDEARAVMDLRHKRVTKGLICPECKSENTYRRGRRCSREFKSQERFVNSPETYRLLTEARDYFLIPGVIKRRHRVFSPELTNKETEG